MEPGPKKEIPDQDVALDNRNTILREVWGIQLAISSRVIQKIRGMVRAMRVFGPRAADRERLFLAPPVNSELANAIQLISPHLSKEDKNLRSFWELDQNQACWDELTALKSELSSVVLPAKILEIGPGMGRSLVFFSKKLGWNDCKIHAYEGNGNFSRYTIMGPRVDDSFCGNIPILKQILEYNNVRNVDIFDAKDVRLVDLPGPYDLIYSFYSIGFHWSLEHFLSDLLFLMHEGSVAIFSVPLQFKPFRGLAKECFRIVEWKSRGLIDDRLKFLVLRKSFSIPANVPLLM